MGKSLVLAKKFLEKTVEVIIDRPLGSKHPKHDFTYEANYGYVPGVKAPDGEELDAYFLGVDKPLKKTKGQCIAIIHRLNDDDDKLVVVPEKINLTDQEIAKAVYFQEKWFDFEILRKSQLQTNLREEIQPIIYRIINNKLEFLIIKKWDEGKNKWCYRLVKGGVEKNETHNQAISREVQEEVGIDGLTIGQKIHHYRFTSFDGITHDVHGYLTECKTPNIFKYKLQNNDEEKIKQVEWCETKKAIELLEFAQEKEAIAKTSQEKLNV